MNWTSFLSEQAAEAYRILNQLTVKVDEDKLDWKPAEGDNWMTVGQLLEHMKIACGAVMQCFVTGDWASIMPEGEGEMPTETLPTCTSLEEFRTALEKDRAVSMTTIEKAGEEALANTMVAAPWNPKERLLGTLFLECIEHLNSHRAQLFYYLKLQGKPVNTMDLWGLEPSS